MNQTASTGLASPIFIPLVGALILRLGWRGTLVVLAVVQLCVALPLHAVVVRQRPEDHGLLPDGAPVSSAPPSTPLSGMSRDVALRQPAFWLLTGAYALATLASTVILVHGIAFLIARGYDPLVAATVMGLVGLASLPGRLLLTCSAIASDRRGCSAHV